MKPAIVLYNPVSNASGKRILPMSLLALGAVLEGKCDYSVVDGNCERDALAALGQEGYEARLFFVANAEPPDAEGTDESDADPEDGDVSSLLGEPVLRDVGPAPEDGELRFDLTKLDRDFLKSLNIRPDGA